MKKGEQSIETMKMVRAIRDKLGKLRRENPEEYFRRLDTRYEAMQRVFKKKGINTNKSVAESKKKHASRA